MTEEHRFSEGIEQRIADRLDGAEYPGEITRKYLLEMYLEDMDVDDSEAYEWRLELRKYCIKYGLVRVITDEELARIVSNVPKSKLFNFTRCGKKYLFIDRWREAIA
jgi:hypothetical protein